MASSSGTSLEQRRWLVVGIALQNVLTPCLRGKIQNEMTPFYQYVVKTFGLDKQKYPAIRKTIPPTTLELNYRSINNNAASGLKPPKYDYCVKDEVSLTKLFMKPFMAHFNAFDSSFDASVALAVLCGAPPFTAVKAFAEDVRSKVRNEWAHCDFAAWTEAFYDNCFDLMKALVTNLRFAPTDEISILDKLELWRKQGIEIYLGKPLDDTLLHVIRNEVHTLSESLDDYGEKADEKIKKIYDTVDLFKSETEKAIFALQEKQFSLETTCEEIKGEMKRKGKEQQDILKRQDGVERKQEQLDKRQEQVETAWKTLEEKLVDSIDSKPIVFDAPDQNKWFTGREKELEILDKCLPFESDKKLKISAVCGLGGCGKTTLAAQFAWKRRHEYEGGVFWISMEDDEKFKNSINDLAVRLGLLEDSNKFDVTLTKVLNHISQHKNPSLMVIDNVDQLTFSDGMRKVLSGRWKRQATGHLLLTTRRETKEVCECIDLDASCCVELLSFSKEEANKFLVMRTGVDNTNEQEVTINELVGELGCLPLALEQAGAHIKAIQCPISKYLEQYRIERLNTFSQHPAKTSWEYGSQSRLAVHTTWLLNFEYIKKSPHRDVTSKFVQAAAFLDPDEIQEDLINPKLLCAENPSCKSCDLPLTKSHIVKLLTKFSLFQRKFTGCLSLHRLVQEVIHSGMTIEETRTSLNRAFRLLFDTFQSQVYENGDITEPLAFHCSSLKRHAGALAALLFEQGIEGGNLTLLQEIRLFVLKVNELLMAQTKRVIEETRKRTDKREKERKNTVAICKENERTLSLLKERVKLLSEREQLLDTEIKESEKTLSLLKEREKLLSDREKLRETNSEELRAVREDLVSEREKLRET